MASPARCLAGQPSFKLDIQLSQRLKSQATAMQAPSRCTIVWLAAAAADRRRIVRYITEQSREPRVVVGFMDTLMGKIELLAHDTVQFKPGRVAGTREYVVHPNYIVVYRIKEQTQQVQIIRLWSAWNQPS